jgi:hypothetical protein
MRMRVVEPLEALNKSNVGGFALTEALANKFYKELSPDADRKDKSKGVNDQQLLKDLEANKVKHLANGDQAMAELDRLLKDLNEVLDAINDGIREDEQIEALVQIEAEHREILRILRNHEQAILQRIRDDLGGK